MDIKDQREYAWSYFQLHAGQRMTTFNFFIVIAALLTTALASTFGKEFEYHIAGVILGFGITIMSFVFWKLDQRVRFLIKNAERSLKEIESVLLSENPAKAGKFAALFSAEEESTASKRADNSGKFWEWHLSYSKCFGAVYLSFAVLGVVGGVGSIWKYLA